MHTRIERLRLNDNCLVQQCRAFNMTFNFFLRFKLLHSALPVFMKVKLFFLRFSRFVDYNSRFSSSLLKSGEKGFFSLQS